MISFKEFLIEAPDRAYKKSELTTEDAIDILLNKCGDFLKSSATNPIIRGTYSSGSDANLVQGDTGRRSSRNTSNYYTVILDEFLPPLGYPKRSRSLICGTYANKRHVSSYGDEVYAMIPYDGVKIGVCPGEDMFDTKIKLFGTTREISDWNMFFKDAEISDDSYNKFLKSLFKFITSSPEEIEKIEEVNDAIYAFDANAQKFVKKNIKTIENLEDYIRSAYTPQFKLIDPSEAGQLTKKHELWIGGKCVQLRLDLYNKFLTDHKINNG